MLATLYAKALDADAPHPILGDRSAKDIVERLDYDWSATTITARRAPAVTTRSLHFDTWARQFRRDAARRGAASGVRSRQ